MSEQMHAPHSSWFNTFAAPRPDAMRLFCFHYAGGGASMYRDWARQLPTDVQVVAVQLPGREKRFLEARYRQLKPLVSELADQVAPRLGERYSIFGHSMGALIGFELIREIQRRALRPPVLYFPAGYRAPQLPDPDPPIHHLPEPQFVDGLLKTYRETLGPVMVQRELREVLTPLMRADFELCETYHYQQGPRLSCPIIALGGVDDPGVDEAALSGWGEQTTGAFTYHRFPGGHFFVNAQKAQVLKFVRRQLECVL